MARERDGGMSSDHVVLLDLDGTLIDSAPGIIMGIRVAFEAVDVVPPTEDVMRAWIGPPVRETLLRELGPRGDAVVVRANEAFRQYFDSVGAHESVLFPGIRDALTQVAATGSRMRLVTHKPYPLAQVAVAQHDLAAFIDGIHAPPSPIVAVPKAQLFADAMAAAAARTAISVGDRGTDILAAAEHGIAGIGVTWGYGGLDELEVAGAVAIADAAGELPALVRAPG